MEKRTTLGVETSLKTAFSYIEEVEKQVEEFKETVGSESQKADVAIESGFWRGAGAALKSNWAISKNKGRLMKDLDLAENEIKSVEGMSPDAHLETDKGVFTIPALKSLVSYLRGMISAIAGQLKSAEGYFMDSLKHFEMPGTYYDLALTLEDLRQPRKACEMYHKCINSANTDIETGASLSSDCEKLVIQARKDLQRLESKKIGNGWFVGSWKVFLGLAGFTVISFFMLFDKHATASGVMGILFFGGLSAGYWWWKWR